MENLQSREVSNVISTDHTLPTFFSISDVRQSKYSVKQRKRCQLKNKEQRQEASGSRPLKVSDAVLTCGNTDSKRLDKQVSQEIKEENNYTKIGV